MGVISHTVLEPNLFCHARFCRVRSVELVASSRSGKPFAFLGYASVLVELVELLVSRTCGGVVVLQWPLSFVKPHHAGLRI